MTWTLTKGKNTVNMLYYPRDGLSTVRLASEKPIVRSPQPQRFNRELLARTSQRNNQSALFRTQASNAVNHTGIYTGTRQSLQLRDSLASQYRWSTTTGEAAAEGALPTPRYPVPLTTLERHADPIRQREKRLALRPEPCIWQQFAREWDMIQARCPMEPRTKPGFSLPKISKTNSIIAQNNEQLSTLTKVKESSVEEDKMDTTSYKPTFTRPTPGYGGFVPRYPEQSEPSTFDKRQRIYSSMCSTTRRTYRGFPKEEYKELTFCHKGPLSKTVTLTYPFNPFNKVD